MHVEYDVHIVNINVCVCEMENGCVTVDSIGHHLRFSIFVLDIISTKEYYNLTNEVDDRNDEKKLRFRAINRTVWC